VSIATSMASTEGSIQVVRVTPPNACAAAAATHGCIGGLLVIPPCASRGQSQLPFCTMSVM
jgi:hypothetical protein